MGPNDEKTTCIYTLSADKALPEDNGIWKCEVTNSHGVTSATCTVRVLDTDSVEEDSRETSLPRFVETLENVVATEDTDTVFRCKTNPDAEVFDVKWYRNDIPIEGSKPGMERYYISSEEGVQQLEIRRTRPRDVGVYKCKIYNKMGWTSCDAKLFVGDQSGNMELVKYTREYEYTLVDSIKSRKALEVYDRGFNEADILLSSISDTDTMKKFLIKWQNDRDQTLCFPIHLKNKCAVEGSLTVLSCLMQGKHPSDVRWYKNNIEIFDSFKYYIKCLQGVLSLTIPNTETTDTGNYTCVVKNRQGKIYSSCYLQVEPALEFTNEVPVKPMFVKPLKRLTVNEGELINFRVTAKGFPPPGFKWFKDGLEIHDSDRIKTEVFPKGVAELTIINSTVRDIGLYTCEAHNMAGRAQSMVRVSVRDKFEQELWKGRDLDGVIVETDAKGEVNGVIETTEQERTPVYTQHVESKLFDRVPDFTMRLPTFLPIHSKQRFLLEIRCNGNPKPYVRWYKDGMQLFDENRYNILSVGDWFGLEIASARPNDAGTYTVKLENDAGQLECSCKAEMQLPVSTEVSFETDMDTVEDLSLVIAGLAAPRTELEGNTFNIAQLVPSFHLCNTEADWTTMIEKEVEVIDADEAPSFPHALPEKLTPHENDEHVHLECQVRGEPIPKIVWLKDGNDLEEGPNISWSMDPKTRIASLMIEKATLTDSGHYSCVAYSESGGHASTSADIQVLCVDTGNEDSPDGAKKTVPEFKVKLSDKETTEGEDVKLECVAEGFPAPKVKWYKNDVPIKPTIGKYTITSSIEGSHSLIIASMHMSDSDCYRCEAVNECGSEATTAHIVVQEPCFVGKDEGESPCFEGPLHNVNIEAGQTATINCVAKGTPTPSLSWLKDGIMLASEGRVSVDSDEGKGMLTITDTTVDDTGVYICIAENALGKAESCASIKINEQTVQTKDTTDSVTAEKTEDITGKQVEGQMNENQNTNEKIPESCEVQEIHQETVTEIDSKTSTLIKEETTTMVKKESMESSTMSLFTDYKKRPRFVIPPLSQWSMKDTPLKIEVEITKSPDMKVNWYHDDTLVVPGDRFKIQVQDGER
ncbi:muscle M-line assembly protein unc-89-like isoform X1 [Mercenaria mercenaria]|uniref:muscle M-line assembly protein unc-89-like isoform X1 n=1 Tax=Mercenaria mercenaria TaxID=6596 RepID=UPI00234F72B7|nr:muscle M-line assembly protein unc-89-like isoform X1 [Mercenaria mercenaria]XP_053378006.1 muscle M-line assembly protein unc-89-like isoform X1 [Mercenaria mercenaria]